MEKRTSTIRKLFLALIALVMVLALAACGGEGGQVGGVSKPEMDENTEFIFTGESSEFTGGRTFHITITGTKDNNLSVIFEEMPMAAINGTWTLVDGKGYKFYFDDGNSTLCYDAYDTEALTHSFVYNVSLGEGYGSAPVSFTMADPDFASFYDGVGLGYAPPVFDGVGYWTPGGTNEAPARLTCKEDGTFGLTSSSAIPSRSGTWAYDEAANVYTFNFDPQNQWTDSAQYRENRGYQNVEMFDVGDDQNGAVEIDEFGLPVYNEASATYDEASGAYTMEVVMSIRNTDFMHCAMSYTRAG